MGKTRFRNGIRHPLSVREEARRLRREGRTHREIVKELGISLGSAALWTQGVALSHGQTAAIYARRSQHEWTVREREVAGARLKPFRKGPYGREELTLKIKHFYARHGRIPLKRELNAFAVFRRHFGSWNNAIIAAGFEPNPILFAKKFVACDGHRCDSFTEKIVDDWLSARHIHHERNWRYAGTKMTADFFVYPGMVIEFFGLAGVQKKYDALIDIKRKFCATHGMNLIELYPRDVFPADGLRGKLDFLL
jgi:Homing endonuclease associated repeat